MPLHPEAEKGIDHFNRGEYFLAHEALENAWNAEGEPERRLYQGILQAGVLRLHAKNGNFRGVLTMYRKTLRWLAPWPEGCRGLDIGKLTADIEALVAEVKRLGPKKMDQIDRSLFTKIKSSRP